MSKLIRFEFKKHFTKGSVAVIFFVFVMINIFRINVIFQDRGLFSKKCLSEYEDEYWECFQMFGGRITNEKIEELMGIYNTVNTKIADRTHSTNYDESSYTYNAYSDEVFFRWFFVDEMKYDYFYKQYANNISRDAHNNLEFYNAANNTYKIRENNEILKVFWGREIGEFAYTEKYLYYLQYDFSALLTLLLCLYAISRVFVYEKETEMETLLITNRKGNQTVAAKIVASFLFVIMISLLFGVLDYIGFSIAFGSFGSNHSPLYSLTNYQNTRLETGLFTFSMLSLAVKIFGIITISMIFLLYSCTFSKVLYSYIASFVTMSALLLMHSAKINPIAGGVDTRILNPVSLIKNRELFDEVHFLNIFNYPIPEDIVAVAAGFGWIILAILLISIFTTKNTLVKKKWRRNKNAGNKNRIEKNIN